MTDRALELVVYGVRGSAPVGGADTAKYGGRTISLGVQLSERHHLLIDCGTGLWNLQQALPEPGDAGLEFSIFLTHYHLDHLQGLPFFGPLYDDRSRFTFYGYPWEEFGVEQLIAGTFRPPWFPVRFEETPAFKRFIELDGRPVEVEAVRVVPERLHHPQGVTAYRLEHGGRAIVIATDHESGHHEYDAALVDLAAGADVLIHDAQYTNDEYDAKYEGWGHSTWADAIATAESARVGELIMISHDPHRTDTDLDRMVEKSRVRFDALSAAYEGLRIPL